MIMTKKCMDLRTMSTTKKKNEPETEVKRMSLALSGRSAADIDYLSESQGITSNEAVRRSIGTECYIRKEIADGSKFFVLKSDGKSHEVVFR
jgi:hypothetical protein